jgi:hypothetical protein
MDPKLEVAPELKCTSRLRPDKETEFVIGKVVSGAGVEFGPVPFVISNSPTLAGKVRSNETYPTLTVAGKGQNSGNGNQREKAKGVTNKLAHEFNLLNSRTNTPNRLPGKYNSP